MDPLQKFGVSNSGKHHAYLRCILDKLMRVEQRVRSLFQIRWKRVLPLDEMVFDRFEKARYLGFGEGSSIYHNSYVFGDVKVGKNTWIGPMTMLDGAGGNLEIGDFCSISSGVHVYTHDSVKWALSLGKCPYEKAPVKIGDGCYIGANCIIRKGVEIGDFSVIGACSFVNKNIPPYSVAAGVPCRIIGKVEKQGDEIKLVYHNKPDTPKSRKGKVKK